MPASASIASTHSPPARLKRTRRTAILDSSSDDGTAPGPSRPSQKANKANKEDKKDEKDKQDDDSWYAIKDIVDERTRNRRLFYLVDWADHPETGESYSPTWIPAKDASSDAVKAWKAHKRQIKNASGATATDIRDSVEESIPSPKPASRKRTASPSPSLSLSPSPLPLPRPAKLQKGLRQIPRPLQSFCRDVSTESPELEVELERAQLVIEVDPGPDFDPSEYLRISQLQSQSQSQSQAPSQAQPRFSPRTIPDSEEDTGPRTELRDSLNWNRQPSPEPHLFPAASSTDTPFLTQPADLHLLSSSEPVEPVESVDPPSWSSVIPDSIRPARVAQDLPSAQIVQPLFSQFTLGETVIPATTSTVSNMGDEEHTAAGSSQLSAVDQLKQAHREAFGLEGPAMIDMAEPTAASATAATSPRLPLFGDHAAPEAHPATIDTALLVDHETAMPDAPHGDHELAIHAPATIAPSALSLLAPVLSISPDPSDAEEHDHEAHKISHDSSPHSATESDHAPSPVSMEAERHRASPSPSPKAYAHEYIVTLPLAANARQRYIDLVMDKENQKTIKEFGDVFARDIYGVPSPESTGLVDVLLQKLLDLTDLPPFYDTLPPMSTEQMMKYAVNTNCKFTFLHEFLEPASSTDKTVLILARKGVVMDYLEALVTHLGIPLHRLDKAAASSGAGADSHHRLSVVLSDTDASIDSLPQDVDFVVGFDHTARTSGLLTHYLAGSGLGDGLPKPIVLLLVAAYTLEHIDLRLPAHSIGSQERKNALLLCTLECLPHIGDTVFEDLPMKPHEAAELFAKVLSDTVDEVDWKPVALPDDVFDIYIASSGSVNPVLSQEESASLANAGHYSRKRPLTSGTDQGDVQKRARLEDAEAAPIAPAPQHPLSKTLLDVLGGALLVDGPTVQISLGQLEALAVRTTAVEAALAERKSQEVLLLERVRMLDSLAKDTTATMVTCERKLLEAVKDRGVFEAERDKAAKEAETAKERLAHRESMLASLKADKTALEAKLAEAQGLLSGSAVPEVARLAAAQAETEAAERRAAALERKVANAETDLAHARRAYQDASNAAADLSSENRDLSTRTKELDRLASANLRSIHETHQQNETEAYRAQCAAMQLVLRDRERELEWAREELRVLKNGRRETRAQSVPRSPRLGVMSPRTVVGRGHSGHSGHGAHSSHSSSIASTYANNGGNGGNSNAHSSSASRGNSPTTTHFDGAAGLGPAPGSAGSNGGNGGGNGGASVAGMTYINPQQGGGRWGHLRD